MFTYLPALFVSSCATLDGRVSFVRLPHILAKCAYRVFFPRKLAFSMAISILFVFLLPVFIRIGIDVEQNLRHCLPVYIHF